MQIYQSLTPIHAPQGSAVALGYFDGVHLGHRALMQRAVERAKQIGGTSAVFTFDVHPDSVVMGRQVPLLTANAYRREEIKQLGGVDEVQFLIEGSAEPDGYR